MIEAVIALMIATMALSFIGTAGYSLRFANERSSKTVNGPDDRLALRRLLHGLLLESAVISGDARSLVLDTGGVRRLLRISESGKAGARLLFERGPGETYPLPSVLLESDKALSFQYWARGRKSGVSLTFSSQTDILALVEAPDRVLARIPLSRGIDPACLLRMGPREAQTCIP